MEIRNVPIGTVKPYEKNPRHNDNAVDAVANSIREFGWKQPIVVDKDNVIIVGHTRLKAAQKLGLKEVPVLIADDLTPEKVKAYRLADNKTNELAFWDDELLDIELGDITDIDMEQFGFDLSEDEPTETTEDDYEVEPPEEPRAKLGDLYQLGNHRLICGDSTDVNVIERLMDGCLADMCITDPPYGVDYSGGFRIENGKIESNGRKKIENDALEYEGLYNFLVEAFFSIKQYVKDRSAVYVFYAHSRTREFLNAFFDVGLKQRSILIWHKTSGGFGDFMAQYMNAYEPMIYGSNGEAVNWYGETNEKTVWDMDKEKECNLHPTMKPVAVIARAIKNSSKQGESVLDVFGGSGTTLIACEQLHRRCYMCELDPHYIDVIIDRWEQFTGEKAVKIGGTV